MRRLPISLFIFLLLIMTLFSATKINYPLSAQNISRNVVLYAYFNEHLTVLDGMTLGLSPTWGESLNSNATIENIFTLFPALGGNLTIRGTVIFKSWLKSDRLVHGQLIMKLYEVTESGEKSTITGGETFIAVSSLGDEYTFGIAGVQNTFKSGSTIQLGLLFKPDTPISFNVYLQWNDPNKATRIILPCIDHIDGSNYVRSHDGRILGKIISLNESTTPSIPKSMEVSLRINVTDIFGIDDVKNVSLRIKNMFGYTVVENEHMDPIYYTSTLYGAVYAKNLTLSKNILTVEVEILDQNGNTHIFTEDLFITFFYILKLTVNDGEGKIIPNATYKISNEQIKLYLEGKTDNTGLLVESLPDSSSVGNYSITIISNGHTVKKEISISGNLIDVITLPIYPLRVKIVTYGIPLYSARVTLLNNSTPISSGVTDLGGILVFKEIPLGNYSISISYLLQNYVANLDFRYYKEYEISFIPPLFRIGPWIFLVGLIAIITAILSVKILFKQKTYHFKYWENLFSGDLPETLSLMILGPPGSGKTVTLENFVKNSIQKGRRCIYITNTAFPDEIRKSLKNFNLPVKKLEEENLLTFIDCYSGIAGQESKEDFFISSPKDLTRLGIEISTCLDSSDVDADILFDSLSQLSSYVKQDQLVSFIHTIGARIKGRHGKFIYTVGSNIDPDILGKIDEASDCVLELGFREVNGLQERILKIKKFKGRKHSNRWIKFEVLTGIGVVFKVKRRFIS